MKNILGIWLPSNDNHFKDFLLRDGSYQKRTLDLALSHVKNFDCAIDVGAHCGLWSMNMDFKIIHAFEPVMEHIECYMLNVGGTYRIHQVALGEKEEDAWIQVGIGNSGHSVIGGDTGESVHIHTLDSFDLKPDFIKIDVEGYEAKVCRGAEKTLIQYHPVICIEQKSNNDGIEYLKTLGYEIVDHVKKDYILK